MRKEINRRALIRVGGSLMAAGAAGMVASQCVPADAPAASASIEAMFSRWLVVRAAKFDSMTDAERESSLGEYNDLQDRITSAEPATTRDMAIQVYVETDGGHSDCRTEFFGRIATLALGGRA